MLLLALAQMQAQAVASPSVPWGSILATVGIGVAVTAAVSLIGQWALLKGQQIRHGEQITTVRQDVKKSDERAEHRHGELKDVVEKQGTILLEHDRMLTKHQVQLEAMDQCVARRPDPT